MLTGDVLGSSQLEAGLRRSLPILLKEAGAELQRAFPEALSHPLDVFRGDSWQLVVSQPRLSLRCALFFRAAVIAAGPSGLRLDTRVAIAVGAVDFVPKERVSEGNGPAYQASGRALDDMADPARMALVLPGAASADAAVIVSLVDALAQEWTPRQAHALKGRLRGLTQAQIAQSGPEPVSQQTVARHLERAHWAAVELALNHLESHSLSGL